MSKRVGVKNPGSRSTLNEKQKLFAIYYLETEMISESVLRAGYQTKNPHIRGTQLLESPLVKAFIAEERAKRRKIQDEEIYSKIMTRGQIALELNRIASSNLALLKNLEIQEAPEDLQRSISSLKVRETFSPEGIPTVTTEVTLWDKVKALKELDNHLKEIQIDRQLEDSLVIDNALQEPEYD